jgi:hypothetical protein
VKKFAQGYGAKFPLFAKIDVNGPNTAPLYAYMKKEQGSFPTSDIKWNFGSTYPCLTASPFRLHPPPSTLLLSIRAECDFRAEKSEPPGSRSSPVIRRYGMCESCILEHARTILGLLED